MDAYLDALCKEIDYASDAFAGKELNTVYIGGGTPTTTGAGSAGTIAFKAGGAV